MPSAKMAVIAAIFAVMTAVCAGGSFIYHAVADATPAINKRVNETRETAAEAVERTQQKTREVRQQNISRSEAIRQQWLANARRQEAHSSRVQADIAATREKIEAAREQTER